jgi:hypothetical protein
MKELKLVYSEKCSSKPPKVYYEYDLSSKFLTIKWAVENSPIFADPHRPTTPKAFALWMMDVVEFFGRIKGNKTYYEFQVSPYGQFFDLEIIKPMKKINLRYDGGMIHQAKTFGNRRWSATMRIPITKLSSETNKRLKSLKVEGNFFAILGEPFKRFHFSAFLPKSKKAPKFHQPKYFKNL